jgi:hypothetical protein
MGNFLNSFGERNYGKLWEIFLCFGKKLWEIMGNYFYSAKKHLTLRRVSFFAVSKSSLMMTVSN